ncbi:MAG: hypothetical protein HKN91_10755 [Acidimicrobiia bacterium]|nr:hypothetical protein [Acidimicrobiia bacterium]
MLLVAFVLAATACTSGVVDGTGATSVTGVSTTLGGTSAAPGSTLPPPAYPVVPTPVWVDENGFNDHSVPQVTSVPEFFALSRSGVSGQSVVKFTIAGFSASPAIRWMDSNFYTLHDEWYWFRLLNGAPVAGSNVEPLPGGAKFGTVRDVYDWALSQPSASLPFDLQFVGSQSVGNRLYSDHFYDLALDIEPRVLGLGSLLYFPTSPAGGGERWVIELEYHDDPTPRDVATFFEVIAASVPAAIGDKLEWVLRSPEQEAAASTLASGQLPFHDRVVRYGDLVAPGQVAVYNEGIAAGRLLLIGPDGKDLSDADETDILLVDTVPDYLPPASALISSAPQTALAHVNILARNRGIPNASQSGILTDAGVQQAARVRAPALVRASLETGLEIVLITEDQYSLWRQLTGVAPIAVRPVNLEQLPYAVPIGSLSEVDTEAELERWRPIIGGKAAGFISLMAAGVSMPGEPLAITVRPYFEHIAGAADALDAMMANTSFRDSRRTRHLMLEGRAAYDAFYTESADGIFADEFFAGNPAGTPVGDILRAGGFPRYLRSIEMDRDALAEIVSQLVAVYGHYSLSQGLRFRSSSSVEDIEGFSGAGLYDSNTGFFRPDIQVENKDQKKSIEWALKATWASYWGFEAFEERKREGVDHRSGGMGVLVHARFDDPLELANGVFTFTIEPEIAAADFSMTINVQAGAISVANPDPSIGALPEVIVVSQRDSATPVVERRATSNLVADSERVLSDAKAIDLFQQAKSVALLWRERVNGSLPAPQDITTLTLDFEFKDMEAGWPAINGAARRDARLVIKQARSLEPGIRAIPAAVADLPIPRDVLARARLIEEVYCDDGDAIGQMAVEVLTDPLQVPDVGFGDAPLVVNATLGYTDTVDDRCAREILYSTPDQFLIELLERGQLLNLSQ